ncbi:hypothetical protein ACFE04_008908 [Oxalis oulophora]
MVSYTTPPGLLRHVSQNFPLVSYTTPPGTLSVKIFIKIFFLSEVQCAGLLLGLQIQRLWWGQVAWGTEGQLESLKYEGDYTRQEIRVLDFSLSTPNSKTSKQ